MVLSIVLIILAVLAFVFAPWIGPVLAKIIVPIVSNPYGAVFATLALGIVIYNFIHWFVSLGKVGRMIK